MMLLPCPWCGPRNVTEFRYAGERHVRPDPGATTPQEWRHYLYTKANPAGRVTESWYHRAGCRKYFGIERDTRTNEVLRTEGGR